MSVKKQDEKLKTNLVGFDDFLEDMFGLNIKGIKTLLTCFKSPQDYYRAAWSPDWQGKFTPSFRLWFTLIAITFFFQFFWAGSDGNMTKAMTASLNEAKIPLPDGVSLKQFSDKYISWYLGLIPLFTAIFNLFLATLYRVWDQKTPFVIRQRNIFATIIPSTTISLFLIMFNRVISLDQIIAYSLITSFIILIVDFITAYRGVFIGTAHTGRIWRASLLALSLQIVAITSATIAAVTAMIVTVLHFS